jgi:hypothetical protein
MPMTALWPISRKTGKKDPAAVSLGRRGGEATAQRGPEYYRQLQAKRKERKGGRAPKIKR